MTSGLQPWEPLANHKDIGFHGLDFLCPIPVQATLETSRREVRGSW